MTLEEDYITDVVDGGDLVIPHELAKQTCVAAALLGKPSPIAWVEEVLTAANIAAYEVPLVDPTE